eukprot:CAMPEP_0206427190 /NCGR_PEP_ID=MMETSP0324_2-20121206/4875_1 /ASSEMBLY_ACC=CAM_ASM_000836 /TAXON_ID=2866 /ORGANISM="Crypthecodinium cohnii, Strain Seligo" /LENGTH=425 /DNA_ID=CAMNT_0053892387 /DNA_START=141 /DNA_END=1418 /DNA_ORIENTATION=+
MALQMAHSGMLPCGNCLVVVPQDRVVAVEYFGSFMKVLEPGLAWAGWDLCGACVTLKGISTRVDQIICDIPSKTRDNVFVIAEVAVQLSVAQGRVSDAVYKLTNIREQLDSYASEVVRSLLPTMSLDDAFEKKELLSNSIKESLATHMEAYGWHVHNALVKDLRVNQDVVRSMNEINKQKRLRDASVMAAEAEKIRTVRRAEAEADAAGLAGEGIARQRGAIIEGLRASLSDGQEISQEDITALLLTTQYFETLKDIGSGPNSQTYFLPDDSKDEESQIRNGLLQGTVGLEYLTSAKSAKRGQSAAGVGGLGTPAQQSMNFEPEPDPPARNPFDEMNFGSPPAPASAPLPAPRSRPAPAPAPTFNPAPAPAPVVAAPRQLVTLQIQVPPGTPAGATLQVQAPDGRTIQLQVPPGVPPGAILQVQI